MFWAEGYDGVDVERIARAVGVTKPSLYNVFGDKDALFLKAAQRYGERLGVEALAALNAEPDIARALAGCCEASVRGSTTEGGRTGCMLACAVGGPSARSAEIRAFFAGGLARAADLLAVRFEREIQAGRLSATVTAKARGRLLVDLLQGVATRARTGVPRAELLEDVRSYLPLLLN